MIVQCDKCKTKFRIADAKVTDAGVKVRCSRCAHVFMVRRSTAAELAPLPPSVPGGEPDVERALREAGLDPSGLSKTLQVAGPPSRTSPPPASGRVDLSTFAPVAPEASGLPSLYPVPSAVPEPARPSGLPASSADAMIALGFAAPPSDATASEVATLVSKIPPTRTAPPPPPPPDVVAAGWNSADLARQLAFEDDPTTSYSAAHPLGAGDPRAKGEGLLTRPYPVAPFSAQGLGGGAPTEPVSASSLFAGFSAADLAPEPKPLTSPGTLGLEPKPLTSPGKLGPLEPKPLTSPGKLGPLEPKPLTSPGALGPFEPRPPTGPGTLASFFDAKAAPTSASSMPGMFDAASLAFDGAQPFEAKPLSNPGLSPVFEAKPLSNPGLSPVFDAKPATNPGQPVIPSFEARLAAGSDMSAFFPPSPELAASPGASGGASMPTDLGDIPGLLQAGATSDDPFAGLDLEGGGTGSGSVFTGSGYAENGLESPTPFDDQADRSTYSLSKSGPAGGGAQQPLAKIELSRSAAQFSANLATTRVSTALPFPEKRPAEPPPRDAYGRWPTLLGLVIGLGLVVLAVLGPAQGHFSRLGPDTLWSLVSPDLSEPIVDNLPDVAVRRAHATAYETKSGRRLLVIAGEAKNEGKESLAAIEAVATVYDGIAAVDRREAAIGVTLGEDVLYAVSTPAELGEAYASALKHTEASAFAPGSTIPFMVVFPELPPDVEHRSFLVEFRRANRQPSPPSP